MKSKKLQVPKPEGFSFKKGSLRFDQNMCLENPLEVLTADYNSIYSFCDASDLDREIANLYGLALEVIDVPAPGKFVASGTEKMITLSYYAEFKDCSEDFLSWPTCKSRFGSTILCKRVDLLSMLEEINVEKTFWSSILYGTAPVQWPAVLGRIESDLHNHGLYGSQYTNINNDDIVKLRMYVEAARRWPPPCAPQTAGAKKINILYDFSSPELFSSENPELIKIDGMARRGLRHLVTCRRTQAEKAYVQYMLDNPTVLQAYKDEKATAYAKTNARAMAALCNDMGNAIESFTAMYNQLAEAKISMDTLQEAVLAANQTSSRLTRLQTSLGRTDSAYYYSDRLLGL